VNWAEFEKAAPDLAHNGRERFERTRVALLGTLRPDGSPRISPIEPYLLSRQLVIGVMRSAKGHDLLRDARCTLHSAVFDVNGSDGEFKLHGRAKPLSEGDLHGVDADAWWKGRPADTFALYAIDIDSASFTSWDTLAGRLSVLRWSLETGTSELSRDYP
jgi:pyridoxamine 5'-phosphate oxidase-like protein